MHKKCSHCHSFGELSKLTKNKKNKKTKTKFLTVW